MGKSPEAFRTISEVATQLETPAHVLRFWESKFPQVKPVKRAGGRRYYRPDDIALLGGIKVLLHEKGMTIKGVQNLLKERGSRHIATLSALPWEGGEIEESVESGEVERVIVGPWAGAATDEPSAPDQGAEPDSEEDQGVESRVEGRTDDDIDRVLVDAASTSVDSAQHHGSEVQRFLEILARCSRERLGAQSERLAPLVARLRALRDAAAERSF
jgi:DNA-binding transcriptional MerR regulator